MGTKNTSCWGIAFIIIFPDVILEETVKLGLLGLKESLSVLNRELLLIQLFLSRFCLGMWSWLVIARGLGVVVGVVDVFLWLDVGLVSLTCLVEVFCC